MPTSSNSSFGDRKFARNATRPSATRVPLSAAVEFKLAQLWQDKGKQERALAGYHRVLELEPDHMQAHVELVTLLLRLNRVPETIVAARHALDLFPNGAKLHKSFVQALVTQNGNLDEAFDYYQLTRGDDKEIEIAPCDILCCCVVRNEAVRLPYFLSFYRQKGIGKFLFVDNGSTDGTREYLLAQPDVYVWQSPYSFNRANFGSAWFELVLRQHGVGHWCLIVDADELLYYPDCENKSLAQLCQELDAKNKHAFTTVLLEMYSDKPIKDTHYTQGQRFEDVCPYFDQRFYHSKFDDAGPYRNQTVYFGGVRQRVFGAAGDYYLSKAPLLRYTTEVVLAGGQHWTSYDKADIAKESGCLLHFKFFSNFHEYVTQEVRREEHSIGALQYKEYAKGLTQSDALTLYDPRHSVRLHGSRQLARLGIIQDGKTEDSTQAPSVEFPTICPLAPDVHRPFWSVMITVYDRTEYLEQALRGVIEQAPDPEAMQIEVINDGGVSPAVRAAVAAVVRVVAGGRATLYCHPQNLGHPHIFNLCIERARGHWVHILHDDDWVRPGFYDALQKGIEQTPEVGAAFCRQIYINEHGAQREFSWLERETPGVLANWLNQVAVFCRLQTPAVVVKRQVYERLGGFCPQANSAFDWEMWKRIAVQYPVWFEPRPLACFRKHSSAETSRLILSGQQIADSRRAVEVSRTYLPKETAEKLSEEAGRQYALYALQVAEKQLAARNYEAALANIREGLICSQAASVQRALIALLLNTPG